MWGRYFQRRAEIILSHRDAVRADATGWSPETAPAWAAPLLRVALFEGGAENGGEIASVLRLDESSLVVQRRAPRRFRRA